MVSGMVSLTEDLNNSVNVRRRAGDSLIKHRPCFSRNSAYIFICCENVVRVHSVATGECVHSLAHEDEVISVELNPNNYFQLLTCTINGETFIWNYEDAVLLKKWKIDLREEEKIVYFSAPFPNYGYAFVGVQNSADTVLKMLGFPAAEDGKNEEIVICCGIVPDQRLVAFGGDGELCSKIDSTGKLEVYNLKQQFFLEYRGPNLDRKRFTSVTCHPKEGCLAAGNESGEIIIWQGVFSQHPNYVRLHWHQLPVTDLQFSVEGSYLYSGGEECTLVKWHLQTEKRLFVPRIGMPIVYVTVSPAGDWVGVSLQENAIHLVDKRLWVTQVIQGLTFNPTWKVLSQQPIPAGLLYDPNSGSVVLNSKPGHLQFFDVNAGKLLYNMDISYENYMQRERNYVCVPMDVHKAAFSDDGNWLTTVEMRDDGESTPEIKLKFWAYDPVKKNYILNTISDNQHVGKVTALKFSSNKTVLTTSLDGTFRLWKSTFDKDSGVAWQSYGTNSYNNHPALSGSFSEDDSLLAVAFDHIITLWKPDDLSLESRLSLFANNDSLKHVEFGTKKSSHLLISTSYCTMYVWNVLSFSLSWRIDIHSTCITKDPFSEHFAVITKENLLVIFKPNSPNPIYSLGLEQNRPFIGAVFVKKSIKSSEYLGELHWQSESQLYFMDTEQQLFTLDNSGKMSCQDSDLEREQMLPIQSVIPSTPFGFLFGKKHKSDVKKHVPTQYISAGTISGDKIQELLPAAAYTAIRPSATCRTFLTALLPRKVNKELEPQEGKSRNTVKENEMEVDVIVPQDKKVDDLEEGLDKIFNEDYDWLYDP